MVHYVNALGKCIFIIKHIVTYLASIIVIKMSSSYYIF